jgi:hypothetical protein
MSSQVVGGPETVRAGVNTLLAETAADELMVTTMVHDHADRVRSYELLAEMFGPGANAAESTAARFPTPVESITSD